MNVLIPHRPRSVDHPWAAVPALPRDDGEEWQALRAAAEEREWQAVIARAKARTAGLVAQVIPRPAPAPSADEAEWEALIAAARSRVEPRPTPARDRDRAWQAIFGKARPPATAAART
jgi:hypothetical protein